MATAVKVATYQNVLCLLSRNTIIYSKNRRFSIFLLIFCKRFFLGTYSFFPFLFLVHVTVYFVLIIGKHSKLFAQLITKARSVYVWSILVSSGFVTIVKSLSDGFLACFELWVLIGCKIVTPGKKFHLTSCVNKERKDCFVACNSVAFKVR